MSRLLGAGCSDDSTCVAIGSADAADGSSRSPFVVTEAAGTWTASLAPRPAGTAAGPSAS